MKPLDITINLVTGAAMLALATGLVLVWMRFTRGKIRWLAVGGLAWAVSVVVKSLVARLASEPLLDTLHGAFGTTTYVSLGALWLGLLTGFTEVPIGWWIAKNRRYHTRQQGIGFGLGFGVLEAGVLAVIVPSLALTEIFSPGNLPPDVLKIVQNLSWDNVAFANVERLFAVAIHVATGMLIVYSIAARSTTAFWIAFSYKSTVDALAGAFHLSGVLDEWSSWVIEAAIFPFAVSGILIIVFLRRVWPHPTCTSEAK
jgi:hypothetical protein